MKTKQNKIIALVVLNVLLFFLIYGILSFSINQDTPVIENTTEYTATVSKLEVNDERGSFWLEINTNEYGAVLYTYSDVSELLRDFNGELPKVNDTIRFRVDDSISTNINKCEFAYIVSLSVNEYDIFTFEQYARERDSEYKTMVFSLIVCLSVASVAIVFFSVRLIKKIKKFR